MTLILQSKITVKLLRGTFLIRHQGNQEDLLSESLMEIFLKQKSKLLKSTRQDRRIKYRNVFLTRLKILVKMQSQGKREVLETSQNHRKVQNLKCNQSA